MTLLEYLATLRRYWTAIAVVTILCGLGGVGMAEAKTPVYKSETTVLLTSELADSGQELLQGSTYVQNLVSSYVVLATSPKVLQPVIDELSLDTTPSKLAARISADSPLNTVLIDIDVLGTNRRETAAIAAAVTESLSDAVVDVSPKIQDEPSIRLTTMRPATVPQTPVAPNKPLYLAVGLLVGLLLGVALALTRRLFGSSINGPEDVALITDVPVVGEIVESRRGSSLPAAVLENRLGLEAESLRALTANLSFLGVDHGLRSLVVTSGRPGESKSSVATAAALVLAEASPRVLLIDADLRKPSIHRLTGLDNSIGLSTVLIGEDPLEVAVQPWAAEGLHVLTSGPVAPNPGQLLSSDAMRALIATAESSYDFVVVDTPPVLSVVDAVWIGHMTNGALVVARRGKTTPRMLRRALDTLSSSRTSVAGVVISRARRSNRSSYAYKTTGKTAPVG